MIPLKVIDASVARVLRAKFALGLFEQPYVDVETAARLNGAREHRELATEAAARPSSFLRTRRERYRSQRVCARSLSSAPMRSRRAWADTADPASIRSRFLTGSNRRRDQE